MSTVKPIPDGYHTITTNLVVNGAAKAIAFYKQALGAVELGTHKAPGTDKVMHAALRIGDSIIFVVDEFPEMGGNPAPTTLGNTTVSLYLYVEDAEAAFQKAVGAGGTALMPVTEMFWGDRMGTVADAFGYKWSFCTHVKDVTEEEMTKAANEFFSKSAGKA